MERLKLVTDEQEFEKYSSCWNEVKKEFFKFEALQIYASDYSEDFIKFQKKVIDLNKLHKSFEDSLLSDPALPYEKINKRHIKFKRVHLVETPLTDYLRYEIESYKVSQRLGEEIFFVTKQKLKNIKLPVSLQDFLLFDDKKVFLQFYDSNGAWSYTEFLTEPKDVKPYIELKRLLLKNSIPMNDFLSRC